jgi:hypothetical protein
MKAKIKVKSFPEEVTALLRRLGAVSATDSDPLTLLHTVAGPLHITPQEDWVAMMFGYPKLANERVGQLLGNLNPHSGKWNFHPERADQEAVGQLESRLRMVLVWVPEMEEERE